MKRKDRNTIKRDGVFGFKTRVLSRMPDGRVRLDTSRRDRKGRGPRILPPATTALPEPVWPGTRAWFRFWAPGRISWWVAWLFIIGSIHFCYGPALCMFPQALALGPVTVDRVGWIYFAGSWFFTSACYLQVVEVLNAKRGPDFFVRGQKRPNRLILFAWEPGHLAFVGAFAQFIGACFFNVNCTMALFSGQSWMMQDVGQWIPACMGSVLFLTSGYISLMEVTHRFWDFLPTDISWWVAIINFLGCAGFLTGAVLGVVLPKDDPSWLLTWADIFNLQGALGFLISSYLMLPEMFAE